MTYKGVQGVQVQPETGGGATLKNFFAYFSASASYGFCDFQNIAQKQLCIVYIVVKRIKH